MENLEGKVAVVTGAASGIGLAMATRFAAEGMKVVMADVEEPRLSDVAGELAASGAEVLAVPTDVARRDHIDALADRTIAAFGAVHVVCNNAGVAAGGPVWTLTDKDWRWVLGVNLWGVIHGIRAFVPRMIEQGEGHVVNTASMAGLTSPPGMAPYNVSKHAVVTLSETLHHELALFGSPGVGVSVVCPGWVDTRIFESDRNRPEELQTAEQADPGREALLDLARQMVKGGIDPSRVADLVVAAVRERRFYVLTHPEWNDMVRTRMDDIVEQRAPTFLALPT